MENAILIFKKLKAIIDDNNGRIVEDDAKIIFRNLINDFLGHCSEILEIPDFLSALTCLIPKKNKRSAVHKDTGDKYEFEAFSVRTSKNNKGIDVIYFKEVIFEGNYYFTKTLKDFCIAFEIDNYFAIEVFNTALKAEKICYSGKGFKRGNDKKLFIVEYFIDLFKHQQQG